MKYYHVTADFETCIKIQKEGLKENSEGYIYFLTDKKVSGYVAVNQLCYTKEYGLIEIDEKGITVEIEEDNVGEYTAPYQRRIKQKLIDAKFIKFKNMFRVN